MPKRNGPRRLTVVTELAADFTEINVADGDVDVVGVAINIIGEVADAVEKVEIADVIVDVGRQDIAHSAQHLRGVVGHIVDVSNCRGGEIEAEQENQRSDDKVIR